MRTVRLTIADVCCMFHTITNTICINGADDLFHYTKASREAVALKLQDLLHEMTVNIVIDDSDDDDDSTMDTDGGQEEGA